MADSRPQVRLKQFHHTPKGAKIIFVGGSQPYLWIGDDTRAYGVVDVEDIPERLLAAINRVISPSERDS